MPGSRGNGGPVGTVTARRTTMLLERTGKASTAEAASRGVPGVGEGDGAGVLPVDEGVGSGDVVRLGVEGIAAGELLDGGVPAGALVWPGAATATIPPRPVAEGSAAGAVAGAEVVDDGRTGGAPAFGAPWCSVARWAWNSSSASAATPIPVHAAR